MTALNIFTSNSNKQWESKVHPLSHERRTVGLGTLCCSRPVPGEGNGSPLQCSCLENPSDRGAWWAAVYGVAQSWTWLKRLSSSSSSSRPVPMGSHFSALPCIRAYFQALWQMKQLFSCFHSRQFLNLNAENGSSEFPCHISLGSKES